jgi:membrane protein DedA with SNARE-associated domain
MQKFLIFSGIGAELGGLILIAFFVGRYLDESYQTKGLIFLGLTLTFLVAWFIHIVWLLKRLQKQTPADAPTPSDRS